MSVMSTTLQFVADQVALGPSAVGELLDRE